MIKVLARNTFSNFGLRFFNIVLEIVSIPIIVEAVGDESYGIILLAISIMGYFNIMEGGVPAGIVKYVSEFSAKDEYATVSRVINTSFFLFIGVGLLIGFSVLIFLELGGLKLFNITNENTEAASNVLKIAAIIAVFQWPVGVFGQALQGFQKYAENNLYVGVSNLIAKLLAILAAIISLPVEIIFMCLSLSGMLAFPFQYNFIKKIIKNWKIRSSEFSTETLKMIYGYSVWMFVKNIAQLLIYQTDRLILSMLLPVSSLTVYHVITIPFKFIQQMSSLFNSAITPLISFEYARGGGEKVQKFIYTLPKYSNAFVAPISIIGFYLCAPFILLWMGPDYEEYAWIAQLGCLFQLLWQMNSTLGRVFYGTGIVKEITLIALFGAVINVPLGIWLTIEIGIAGVVFSTIFAGLINIPLEAIFAMPKLDMDRVKYFLSVIKGQYISWLGGLILLPFFVKISMISDWVTFIVTTILISILFYVPNLSIILHKKHKKSILNKLKDI